MESKYLLENRLSVRNGAVGVTKIPFLKNILALSPSTD